MDDSGRRQIVGIFGGSFNPIHVGHLMIASYLRQYEGLDQVWLTLSPLNPLKAHPSELIPDIRRLAMLRLATEKLEGIGVCDIELSMPRPSYTADTLRLLTRRYRNREFRLVIGSDNWRIFDKWKDSRFILDNFRVLVYPRPGYPVGTIYEDNVDVVNSPVSSLSSSFIRAGVAQGKDMRAFLPEGVWDYIKENDLYHIR